MSMQGGAPRKPRSAACAGCGASLTSASKTVINGLWHCAACTYIHDYPDKQTKPILRKTAAPIQEETLFPLPSKREDSR